MGWRVQKNYIYFHTFISFCFIFIQLIAMDCFIDYLAGEFGRSCHEAICNVSSE